VFAPPSPDRALTWAQRLKRVFAIDIETCRQGGGRQRHSDSLVSQQQKRPRDRKLIWSLYPLDHKNVSAERTLEVILSAMCMSIL
jgi:hypothetical protein